MKERWVHFFSYILFLILSPIRFLPYTFSPLFTFSNFANLWCTPKQNQAPFLSSKDPHRTPFKTLEGLLLHKAMKECWKVFFSYKLFLIFSPIRFLPYTFSPLSILTNLQNFNVPQNKTKPLLIVARIPKEHPFRHLEGIPPHKAKIECWKVFSHIYCS